MKISASIVFFKTNQTIVASLLQCLATSSIKVDVYCIDNSPTNILSEICRKFGTTYIHSPSNLGFGAAHNLAIKKLESDIHFIINPDIKFDNNAIEKMAKKIYQDHKFAAITPRVTYPDNRTQHLCKLLPTPANLISRRFIPFLAKKLDKDYEMQWFGYNYEIFLPCATGCFMGVKTKILKNESGFDERFFMYMEDIDLSRRIAKHGKILFSPSTTIVHDFAKSSYKNKKLLLAHIKSAIYYFNKWGWLFDRERTRINNNTRSQEALLQKLGQSSRRAQ